MTFAFGNTRMINASGVELTVATEDLTITAKQFTGVNEIGNLLDAKVYPTPATNSLYISASGGQLKSITIYNTLGALVLHEKLNGTNQDQININNLAAGVYTARIEDMAGKARICRIVRNISH
jgi:hypothetical protein